MNNYDLAERTEKYSIEILRFCKSIRLNEINKRLVDQLVRSGTSIGANYCEANNASSRRDFKNKIYICKKEAQETKYWIRMLVEVEPACKEVARRLWAETHQLLLIFAKIIHSLEKKDKSKI